MSKLDAQIRSCIEAYVAAWNEHDPAKRAELLERSCTDDFHMRTPGKLIEGRGQLDALMADFQRRWPAARAVLASPIDVQSCVFRYTGVVEGATFPDTLDVGESGEDGRIRVLFSFVGAALPIR